LLEDEIAELENTIRLSEEQNRETEARKNDPKELEKIRARVLQECSSRKAIKEEFEKYKAYFYKECDNAIQSRLGTIQRHRATIPRHRQQIAWFQSNAVSAQMLKERFPDYEIEETTYPSVEDFTNQQPRHLFIRLERAENVYLLRTIPTPDPEPQRKAAVLEAMKA
jgi:hypothetical protein